MRLFAKSILSAIMNRTKVLFSFNDKTAGTIVLTNSTDI